MTSKQSIPWQAIYDFVLSCGKCNDIYSFSSEILSKIQSLCQFDQALVFTLSDNSKVCNQFLVNIDERWSDLYLSYYLLTDNGRYNVEKRVQHYPAQPTVNLMTWENEPSNEFVPHYIQPRGLKFSLGFALYDQNGRPRSVFALDKTKNENFTYQEYIALNMALPLLNNLHMKFFHPIPNLTYNSLLETLTPREAEIMNLLCQGTSPTHISESLYISLATTYKHIANIYEKMNVSSMQELLVKVLTTN